MNKWHQLAMVRVELAAAVTTFQYAGVRRALTTWHRHVVEVHAARDSARRVGKLLFGRALEHRKVGLTRRALWRMKSGAAAMVVAAFEKRFRAIGEDTDPVDPILIAMARRRALRRGLRIWNRGMAARRRVFGIWAKQQEGELLHHLAHAAPPLHC